MTSLDGLRALEQAASPGPWRAYDDHWIFDAADEVVFAGSMLIPDDAEFVVAARNALPGLLGRVEAAEAERDALRELAHAARNVAAAPDYDGEAIRDALWALVDAVLAASVPSGPAAGPTTSKETR